MPVFTTRPELRGTFGMVASTHWLASQAGISVLERGGNAFDAACATGFVLQVVEPHLNGPGGEMPAVFYSAERDEVRVLCGQGVAPRAATIERFHELGHELVPGTGVLAACVPGAFGAWLLLLLEFGTWRLEDILELPIGYAETGFPLVRGVRTTIDRTEGLLATWPGSRDLYLPAPEVGSLFRNPALAATYRRIVEESRGGSREEEIERARLAFYEGFVAEEIDRFCAAEEGLLTGDDLSAWTATFEPAVSFDYHGLTVCKTGAWGAGPVVLQQLALLRGFDLAELSEAELVHVVTECAKLAFADRDALYGDTPDEVICGSTSCSRRSTRTSGARWSARRPRRSTGRASGGFRGSARRRRRWERASRAAAPSTSTLPTASATSSPRRPAEAGCRARLSSLRSAGRSEPARRCSGSRTACRPRCSPGARPRTTLCPGFALRDGKPHLAWGTPGGDQQEQWALHVFLRHVDLGLDLQGAIDAPAFHTDHLISSFYPRGFASKSLALESRFGSRTVADLQRRGHDVTLWPPWSLGRVTAVAREPDGLLKAAASPRGMQGYAVGR